MDFATLANQAVKFLVPALPGLISAGQKAAGQVAEKIGSAAWDLAKSLWERLGLSAETAPDAAEAAERVAEKPDDDRLQTRLSIELEKLFEKDNDLAKTIEETIKNSPVANTVIASGDRSVAVGRDVSGSNIITGDQNKIGSSD